MWVYLWALYSIPLIHLSGFVPVPYCFEYYGFVYHTNLILKSGSKTNSSLVHSQALFGYPGSSVVPHKFWDYLFCEKCNGYFDSDCTKYEDYFGLYGHFNNVNSFITVVYLSIY